MTEPHVVDGHLIEALDEILTIIYDVKQVEWAAPRSPTRNALDDLKMFLIEQSHILGVAEEHIDGRSATATSPSAHLRGNIVSESAGPEAAAKVLCDRLHAIADGARSRRAAVAGSNEAGLFEALAAGLDERVRRLEASIERA